ncbi:MAG: DNA helicase [Proteobacteria bacterium]|nr:MAG: DNA helicase [Pseudomonadota bacterium]
MDIRVGFSDEFFGALTKLQPNIQAKVNQLVLKFQTNPKSPGLNFEKLNAVKDKNMRSLRVDQTYRVILSAPEKGNVYLFLWVDHHDKAYDWAASHQCKVNPNTGSIQLYSTQTEVADFDTDENEKQKALFDQLKDRQLLKLGVPEEQLELVRGITSEVDLDRAQALLPQEAYEALFYYSAGDSYENILLERELEETETFDASNFAGALDRLQSMARFVVPENETELSEMLNASVEKWRVFLHPSQRKLAEGVKNGAVRVLGGAGTGKTVVAMHRAKWLASHLASDHFASDSHKVLFTTFTKNLAVDINKNLESICDNQVKKNIEVINLDQWVQRFLRKHSYDYEVIFDDSALDKFWKKALSEKPSEIDFSDSFFKEEWQRVVQPQGIKTLNDYKKASRIGRGTRLNREQRFAIWPVFEEYRHQLNRARLKEVDDAYRDAAELIKNQHIELPYCAVVVDEAQDMGTQAFNLLRAIVPEGKNDLFIVGDAHQRIYGRNKVILGKCGINIRGRSRKLKINYRTTDEIRRWAVGLLEGRNIDDLDGGEDSNSIYKSLTHGEAPVIERFENPDEQAAYIKALLSESEEPASHSCVVARTNKEVSDIQERLEKLGLKTSVIKPSEPDMLDDDTVKLATVHRVKGLEFDQVILASANDGLIPLEYALKNKADALSQKDADTEERSLVYVAITRARKSAFVLSYGAVSEYFAMATPHSQPLRGTGCEADL